MQESYEKRFNLLINGIEETDKSVWEKRETTLQLVQDFMKRGLQIKDPSAVMLSNYHCLPQHPVLKNGIKVNRSIIIKLTNSNDKRLIFNSLKNLKQFNNARKLNKQNSLYITKHLPKQFQLELKALLPAFKEAKALKKKTSWRAENGHYCLCINITLKYLQKMIITVEFLRISYTICLYTIMFRLCTKQTLFNNILSIV